VPGPVTEVVFAPDGRRLLAAWEAGTRVWDLATGEAIKTFQPRSGPVQHALFTPDGSRVALLGPRDQLEVYDLASGTLQASRPLPGRPTGAVPALTPDGRAAAVLLPFLQNVEVRDLVTGEVRAGPFRHVSQVTGAAFSPDGRRLAVATADGVAFIWDVATGRPAAPPLQHGQSLRLVTFSRDGRSLATVAEDRTVRAWDVATGQPLSPLLPHAEPVAQAQLAPDGSRITVRGRSGAGSVWDLTPDARPVDDLVRLTQLLSGQVLDGTSGGFEPIQPSNLRVSWPRLRARYPQEFTPARP
jgi:WD40 repeat protein